MHPTREPTTGVPVGYFLEAEHFLPRILLPDLEELDATDGRKPATIGTPFQSMIRRFRSAQTLYARGFTPVARVPDRDHAGEPNRREIVASRIPRDRGYTGGAVRECDVLL